MLIWISLAALISTFLGGMFALRFKDKLHLILGFAAGAIIGVSFFNLLPNAIELTKNTHSISFITLLSILGFIIYALLDKFILLHSKNKGEYDNEKKGDEHSRKGILGPGSLSVHSFLDGIVIGLTFQVSPISGFIVASAVLVHDFSDGINTVNMIIKNSGNKKKAFKWLLVDSLAPVLGILSTLFFVLPKNILGVTLAVFTGFLLYIGSADLLPEGEHNHSTFWTTVATILGIFSTYTAIQILIV